MEKGYFLFLATLVACFPPAAPTIISSAVSNNNTRDLDALLAFKATVVDPQNILPTNWSTSTSACDWIGITCNSPHQRVAAIDLPKMDLVGTMPPQLGNLSFLVRLNLSNNSFHGNLPNELAHLRRLKYIDLAYNSFDGEIPSWLGALSQLRYLSFIHNKFSGSLSPAVFNSTKLQAIRLAQNKLGGPLPRSLFNLSSLQSLSLTNNTLSGYLPAHICDHLPQLQGVSLSYNEFGGEIPSGIGDCSKIRILSLSYNNLGGNIPREIWNITTLWSIALGGNDLQGEIPGDIGNLTNLEQLGIENANLTGVIPRELVTLKLEFIYLAKNRLKSPIPPEFFNISTLTRISMSFNDFGENLPSTIGVTLPNLEILSLGYNKFTGVIPYISNASRLFSLDLAGNQLGGEIPHSLGSLRFLEILSLANNNFGDKSPSGELGFFVSIGNCRYLRKLWLGGNPLNGLLPMSIGNLSSFLELFDANTGGIGGEIPRSIGNLSSLNYLDLGNNDMKGFIPTTISGLLKIQQISLENNKLQGTIPSEFCNLPKLGSLILSTNRLSSNVPSCIGSITSLRYLYLNSNNLSSSVPTSLWSLRDMLELDLSVNNLIGSLSPQIGNLKALTKMNLSMNQFFGEIPSTIGVLQNLQELSLKHNKLQGPIPESMKNMLGLQYLDMSFNNLAGAIPNSLELLLYLQYLNLSYNRLQGPIPRGGPFRNFTSLSFLANEALCGASWLQPCQSVKHRSRRKILLFVLLPVGSVILALAISLLLTRKLTRKKVMPPASDLIPHATYQRVSYHELRQITNGFGESNLLGSGTFGSVYKGICADGVIWAVKVFNMQLNGVFESFERECEVLCRLRHRNLIKVISTCSSPDFKALILEYMPNGSLEKWLYHDHPILSIMQRLDIMIDVACGLEYLHCGYSFPVVHCDLKPSNILLDEDMVGHVSDFGIAKLLGDGESWVQTKSLATIGYIAPEHGLQGLVSTRCDVYSFGITLMEAFTRKRPKDEMFTEELSIRRWIQESLHDSMNQVIDVNLLDPEDELATEKIACVSSIFELALSCTADTPEERTNIKDALTALKKIKFQLLQINNHGSSIQELTKQHIV